MTTLLGDDELSRIKAECMDSVLDISAAPYFDIRAIYDVIQAHVPSSATAATTSATAVTAVGPTTLTLASVTGLASGSRVVLDVDSVREVGMGLLGALVVLPRRRSGVGHDLRGVHLRPPRRTPCGAAEPPRAGLRHLVHPQRRPRPRAR